MERIAGRQISAFEQDLTRKWIVTDCLALNQVLKKGLWKMWPKEPALGIEGDPGETNTAPYDD
jgi:hypothetical protein